MVIALLASAALAVPAFAATNAPVTEEAEQHTAQKSQMKKPQQHTAQKLLAALQRMSANPDVEARSEGRGVGEWALRVISPPRGNSVVFGAKRTLTMLAQPDLCIHAYCSFHSSALAPASDWTRASSAASSRAGPE